MSDIIGDRFGAERPEPIEPRTVVDSDGDGVSDAEEALAGTDPNVVAPVATLIPVLEATLPPLGASAITAVIVPATIEPDIAVTAPPGVAVDATLAGATLTGTLATEPSHYGVELDGRLAQPTIADAVSFGDVTGTSATVAPASSFGAGYLGALPGIGMVAADGDGTNISADADGNVVTTKIETTENEGGTTKKTEVTTEGANTKVVTTTIETNEADGDSVKIVQTDTYERGYGGDWERQSSVITADGTKDGQEFHWRREQQPNTYDSGEDTGTLPTELAPVIEQMLTGVDPTTTTPSGPDVDDGGAEPITVEAVAGGTGALGVIIKPGIVDGGYEVDVVADGDPAGRLTVLAPDTVNPGDPDFAGGEPITAGDLDDPHNPVADSGGEDEDLEDLEIQRLTPRTGATAIVSPDAPTTTQSLQPLIGTDESVQSGSSSAVADDVTAAPPLPPPVLVTEAAPLAAEPASQPGRGGGPQRGVEHEPVGRGHAPQPAIVPEVITDAPATFGDGHVDAVPAIDDATVLDSADDGLDS